MITAAVQGLFPYGKSGLKFAARDTLEQAVASLPVWEEWIEMAMSSGLGPSSSSLPVWEEWIEITRAGGRHPTQPCLFPYGKSGLKWDKIHIYSSSACLFPYGKSGLKYEFDGHCKQFVTSLPVWEEWIEIR